MFTAGYAGRQKKYRGNGEGKRVKSQDDSVMQGWSVEAEYAQVIYVGAKLLSGIAADFAESGFRFG